MTRPASSNAVQNFGTSLSARTRSRLLVALRSTPRQGLAATISCFAAQEKIAEAAASTWLASTGASIRAIMVRTSARVIDRRLQLAPARQQVTLHERVGLLPALVALLGVASRDSVTASSAKVPAPRSARFSAAGSLPRATASMVSAAKRAGVRQPDGSGVAQVQPARPAVVRIDALPRLRAGRLHPDGESALQGVPHHVGVTLGLELAHRQLGQAAF